MDKLLLIDDEADVRYSFERIFGQQDGLELHTAGSGEQCDSHRLLEVTGRYTPPAPILLPSSSSCC